MSKDKLISNENSKEKIMEISDVLRRLPEEPDNVKNLLEGMVETNSLEHLEKFLLRDIHFAIVLYLLFVETGLECTEDNTPSRNFFLILDGYIINNATPAMKRALEETFGFTKRCDLYSLDDLAKELGVNSYELLLVKAKN